MTEISKQVDWRDTVTWYTYQNRFTTIIRFIFRPVFSSLVNLELVGVENIPTEEGAYIAAANHLSNLDVIYLGLFMPCQPHFMAKKELFKNPALGWVIRQLGSFPVYRGDGDIWAMGQARHVLDAGKVLFMFPEGTRSGPNHQLRRGKIGVAKLALEKQVLIMPVSSIGTQNLKLGHIRNNKIKIQFGKPIDPIAIVGTPPYDKEALREVTTVVMKQIAAMLPPAYRGKYA